MDIEELSVFGLYSQKENKVTAALLQLINSGGKFAPLDIKRIKRPILSSYLYSQ